MIFYVFTTYGARTPKRALKYPAAAIQMRMFADANYEMEEDATGLVVEKASAVESINSLPVLLHSLEIARRSNDRVFIDDFRRIFSRCPPDKRRRLIREIGEFEGVFWELRAGGRSFADLGVNERQELRSLVGTFRTKRKIAVDNAGDPERRRQQTHSARHASAESRKELADARAKAISEIRDALLKKHPKLTLEQLASEVNRRGFKTARGGTWSPATIKRMLDRAATLDDET